MRTRRGGGGAIRGVSIGFKPTTLRKSKGAGAPKPQWDETLHDLSNMKLTPRELEERKKERVSRHYVRVPKIPANDSIEQIEYFEDDADMSAVISGLNARAWEQEEEKQMRANEAAEALAMDYASVSREMQGKKGSSGRSRAAGSRLLLPAWGSRAAASKSAGGRGPAADASSAPRSPPAPTRGMPQPQHGRPLSEVPGVASASAAARAPTPADTPAAPDTPPDAAPAPSPGVVDFEAEVRSFQQHQQRSTHASRVSSLQKQEGAELPSFISKVTTSSASHSEEASDSATWTAAGGSTSESATIETDAYYGGRDPATEGYSTEGGAGAYYGGERARGGDAGGTTTEYGATSVGQATSDEYSTSPPPGESGTSQMSGSGSQPGMAHDEWVIQEGVEEEETEETESGEGEEEGAPQGVPASLTPEKGRWPPGGSRAEAAAAERAARAEARARDEMSAREDALEREREVALLRGELLACREDQRALREEVEAQRAHNSALLSTIQSQLTRFFSGAAAPAPAPVPAGGAPAAPPPSQPQVQAPGAPAIRQAPGWLDRVETATAQAMGARGQALAPAMAPPHAPLPPVPSLHPGSAPLAKPRDRPATFASGGWASQVGDARVPISELDDEIHLPSYGEATSLGAGGAAGGGGYAGAYGAPAGPGGPREAWGPDPRAPPHPGRVSAHLAGEVAAARSTDPHAVGGAPPEPRAAGGTPAPTPPGDMAESHPTRAVMNAVPTFKLASTRLPPATALFHTAPKPSPAPPAVPRYTLPAPCARAPAEPGTAVRRVDAAPGFPAPAGDEHRSMSLRAHTAAATN